MSLGNGKVFSVTGVKHTCEDLREVVRWRSAERSDAVTGGLSAGM